MTHTVVLVGCGAAKRDRYCAAKDLYTSTYFEKKRAYAEAVGDSWFILSAKHKLFDPDRWLAPYDMTMDDVADTEQWARFVGGELHHHCSRTVDGDAEVIVLAGRDYNDPLRSVLEELNIEYRCPFDDTSGIGDQLAWLTERIDAASDLERVITDGGVETGVFRQYDVTHTKFRCESCGDTYVFVELGDWPTYCPTCGHDHSEQPERGDDE